MIMCKKAFNLGRKTVLCIFSAAVLAACGYTFQGGGSVLPPDVKRVCIPLAENDSVETGLTLLLTEAVRDQFDRYGVITVVDELKEADAVLRLKILKVKRGTGTVTSRTDETFQLDTTLTLAAELKRITGQTLWRNPAISVTRTYGATGNAVVTSSADFAGGLIGGNDLAALQASGSQEVARSQEREALAYLSERAARIIYDSAVAPDF